MLCGGARLTTHIVSSLLEHCRALTLTALTTPCELLCHSAEGALRHAHCAAHGACQPRAPGAVCRRRGGGVCICVRRAHGACTIAPRPFLGLCSAADAVLPKPHGKARGPRRQHAHHGGSVLKFGRAAGDVQRLPHLPLPSVAAGARGAGAPLLALAAGLALVRCMAWRSWQRCVG